MLYNQTGSTVWLFKGRPIAAWSSSDVPKWLAESPGVKALITDGTLGHSPATPVVEAKPEPVPAPVPKKASKKVG